MRVSQQILPFEKPQSTMKKEGKKYRTSEKT